MNRVMKPRFLANRLIMREEGLTELSLNRSYLERAWSLSLSTVWFFCGVVFLGLERIERGLMSPG